MKTHIDSNGLETDAFTALCLNHWGEKTEQIAQLLLEWIGKDCEYADVNEEYKRVAEVRGERAAAREAAMNRYIKAARKARRNIVTTKPTSP